MVKIIREKNKNFGLFSLLSVFINGVLFVILYLSKEEESSCYLCKFSL